MCYLHAGELGKLYLVEYDVVKYFSTFLPPHLLFLFEKGYEVSQGNSAFILRRKIHQQLFDENFGVSLTQIGSVMWKRSENYSETLAISGN